MESSTVFVFEMRRLEDPEHDGNSIMVVTEHGAVGWRDFLGEGNLSTSTPPIRYKKSKNTVRLPLVFSPDLAYLLGALVGDGCVQSPIKRRRGGYYWRISFSGELPYLDGAIRPLFVELFGHEPKFTKKKGRERSWHMNVDSVVIYRFFNRVLGVPHGEKRNLSGTFQRLGVPREHFKHFLAGLIDTDGHISTYVNLTQEDREFLETMMSESRDVLGIDFRGPYVNKKVLGEPVAWCLSIHSRDSVKEFIKTVPLRYKRGP